jgi:hypothetical protein
MLDERHWDRLRAGRSHWPRVSSSELPSPASAYPRRLRHSETRMAEVCGKETRVDHRRPADAPVLPAAGQPVSALAGEPQVFSDGGRRPSGRIPTGASGRGARRTSADLAEPASPAEPRPPSRAAPTPEVDAEASGATPRAAAARHADGADAELRSRSWAGARHLGSLSCR